MAMRFIANLRSNVVFVRLFDGEARARRALDAARVAGADAIVALAVEGERERAGARPGRPEDRHRVGEETEERGARLRRAERVGGPAAGIVVQVAEALASLGRGRRRGRLTGQAQLAHPVGGE